MVPEKTLNHLTTFYFGLQKVKWSEVKKQVSFCFISLTSWFDIRDLECVVYFGNAVLYSTPWTSVMCALQICPIQDCQPAVP